MSEEKKLLPCPFCGHGALTWECWDDTWYVECSNENCGCMIDGFPTEAEAVKAWNRRVEGKKKDTLHPCPKCGYEHVRIVGDGSKVFIQCDACGHTGLHTDRMIDAIAAWQKGEKP